MGPLAVRTDMQGTGLGTEIVSRGIEVLRQRQCRIIGLETMPRTMDNIGFYSQLGFVPSNMTVTFTLDAQRARCRLLSQLGAGDADEAVRACAALVNELQPGIDFSRELLLTRELGVGDTVLLMGRAGLDGFALCHEAPLVEGRPRDEVRVLKLAARDSALLAALTTAIGGYARECGVPRFATRVQCDYTDAYRHMVAAGGRVRWTDLRMTMAGCAEMMPARGIVFSNWEL